jgi:hypothetical protein
VRQEDVDVQIDRAARLAGAVGRSDGPTECVRDPGILEGRVDRE